jgi:undecaprenyl-diphosphatase
MSATRHGDTRLLNWLGFVVLVLVWLAMLLFGTGRLDQHISEMLYAGGSPMLVRVARRVTRIGDPEVLVTIGLIVAAVLALRDRFQMAITLTVVFVLGRALVEVQKYGVGRVRPSLEPHLVAAKTFSFVSGHAANSMIILLGLALTLAPAGRWRSAAVVVAILGSVVIGLSRLMLGVHWPSDVIGGWAYGVLWVLAALKAAERLLAVPVKR